MHVGQYLKDKRKAKGITTKEMAAITNLKSRQLVEYYEKKAELKDWVLIHFLNSLNISFNDYIKEINQK